MPNCTPYNIKPNEIVERERLFNKNEFHLLGTQFEVQSFEVTHDFAVLLIQNYNPLI
jgi:hypothetical protein